MKKELQTYLTSLSILPYSLIMMPFVRRKLIESRTFFSLEVDLKKDSKLSSEAINKLGLKRVLIRVKLSELDILEDIKKFVLNNQDIKVIAKIIVSKEHVKNRELLNESLDTLFSALYNHVEIFEFPAFHSEKESEFQTMNQYNRFFKSIHMFKELKFHDVKLLGSGVSGFKYYLTSQSIFNFLKYKMDGVSSLMYVDKQHSPESTQLGFSLSDKIAWLSTMVWLSPKTKHDIHITEADCNCDDEKEFIDYMIRYHLLAFASQQVNSLSWNKNKFLHNDSLAINAYSFMLNNLKDAQFLRLDIKRDYYILQCLIDNSLLQIHWSLKDTELKNEDYFEAYNYTGEVIEEETLKIGSSPVYIYLKDAL